MLLQWRVHARQSRERVRQRRPDLRLVSERHVQRQSVHREHLQLEQLPGLLQRQPLRDRTHHRDVRSGRRDVHHVRIESDLQQRAMHGREHHLQRRELRRLLPGQRVHERHRDLGVRRAWPGVRRVRERSDVQRGHLQRRQHLQLHHVS